MNGPNNDERDELDIETECADALDAFDAAVTAFENSPFEAIDPEQADIIDGLHGRLQSLMTSKLQYEDRPDFV